MAITMNDITPNGQVANGSLKQKLARYLLGELVGYDKQGNMNDPTAVYDPNNILASANDMIAKGTSPDIAKKAASSMIREGNRISPFIGADANIDKAGIGDWAKLTGTAAMHHPFKTAGLGLLGAGNIGGLTDNDKFGGQLAGLGLGGLGGYAALSAGNPYLAAMLTLGGGELGSLFDKLRARKEQEQAYGRR